MPWRLQARSNFFSVSVCVCPLFLWEIVNLSLLDIYSWRNRRRRASIVSQWFLVLPCHVSTDWSSAVECPKMPKVNACRAKTQLMICYKFISKDLLNRLKKSGVDSVDSFRCHWIQSFERRCLGSLIKPCTESGSSGSTGDMSQMNIHESESNFAGHLRPPWMTKWWNDERIWTLRLYISRWTLAEVLRPIIYQKHLPDPFNCCFCCWKFMKVLQYFAVR